MVQAGEPMTVKKMGAARREFGGLLYAGGYTAAADFPRKVRPVPAGRRISPNPARALASSAMLAGSGTAGASIAAKMGAFEQSPVPQNRS